MGKGHKQTREPALPPATLAECGPLLESALKLMDEAVPEFLPAAQQRLHERRISMPLRKVPPRDRVKLEGLDLGGAFGSR